MSFILIWTDKTRKAGIDVAGAPDTVARIALCYRASRELAISTSELSERHGITLPMARQSLKRGEMIVKENELKIVG